MHDVLICVHMLYAYVGILCLCVYSIYMCAYMFRILRGYVYVCITYYACKHVMNVQGDAFPSVTPLHGTMGPPFALGDALPQDPFHGYLRAPRGTSSMILDPLSRKKVFQCFSKHPRTPKDPPGKSRRTPKITYAKSEI